MLPGDSLSTASHASPHFATPQTPAALHAATSMGVGFRVDGFDERAGNFASASDTKRDAASAKCNWPRAGCWGQSAMKSFP